MVDQDDLQAKLEILTAIEEDKIQRPHNIPIPLYAQEAENLYIWVLEDKDALIGAGLDWELVEDLPVRFGALKTAEALWNSDRLTGPGAAAIWAQEFPGAYAFRKEILHNFRFAFRNRPDLLDTLRKVIDRKRLHSSMIQDLLNLEVLGTANADLLKSIGFDMTLLDKALEIADDMRRKFAEATNSRLRKPENKEIRDRAYTHLKEAVDEICRCGQFVFKGNRERLHGYRSEHRRGRTLNWQRENKKKKAAAAEIPIPSSS